MKVVMSVRNAPNSASADSEGSAGFRVCKRSRSLVELSNLSDASEVALHQLRAPHEQQLNALVP